MELKAESRAESGFPQGTLLPIIRSPGPDEALCSTALDDDDDDDDDEPKVGDAILNSVRPT
jgi:hypothetical protein